MKNISFIRIALLPLYDIFKTETLSNGNIIVTGGYESELLEMILRSLKLPYKILIPADQEWGVEKEDGNWSGVVGMVLRDEADIAFKVFMTEKKFKVVDFSFPYNFFQARFVTRKPVEIHSSMTFIYPFDVYLWTAVVLTLLCVPIVMKFVYSNRRTFEDWLFYLLGSLFRQPVPVCKCAISGRIILASVVLGIFLISVSYSSVLLSFLTVPPREEGVKDVKTLAAAVKNKNMKIYALETNSPKVLSDHPRPDVRYLMKQIVEKKWILKADPDILLKYIFEKNNALMGSHFVFRTMFGHEDYLLSDDLFSTFPEGIIMKKNFKFRGKIDNCIHRLNAFGIFKKITDHFAFSKEKHFDDASSDFNLQITLEMLHEVFIVLLVGYALAILTCFLEILHFYYKRDNQGIIT